MVAVKLQKLGDEYHLALDAEAVATLGACEGDLLSVDCAKSTHVKAASDQIALGLALMERYRGAFERLAKELRLQLFSLNYACIRAHAHSV